MAREGLPSVPELLLRAVEALSRVQGAGRDFLTAEQFARELEVTPRAVRQMMDRGELPWAKLGRHRVVLRAQLLTKLAAEAQRNEPRRWPA